MRDFFLKYFLRFITELAGKVAILDGNIEAQRIRCRFSNTKTPIGDSFMAISNTSSFSFYQS